MQGVHLKLWAYCKCLKNVECFVVLGSQTLKGITQNTLSACKINRFNCVLPSIPRVRIIPSINKIILFFQI